MRVDTNTYFDQGLPTMLESMDTEPSVGSQVSAYSSGASNYSDAANNGYQQPINYSTQGAAAYQQAPQQGYHPPQGQPAPGGAPPQQGYHQYPQQQMVMYNGR